MDNFAEALSAIRDLKETGVVSSYAIGGAMALAFWAEAIPTYDLDVFVEFRSEGFITSLAPMYEWARGRGYELHAEHIVIAGIPVQVIPAHNQLTEEAIHTAVELSYDGESVPVIRPEYLAAMFLAEVLEHKSDWRESQHSWNRPRLIVGCSRGYLSGTA